jgi:hypothetical protein
MEKSAITESDLDHNARKAREELLDRKRARDLQRQKLAEQNKGGGEAVCGYRLQSQRRVSPFALLLR